MYKNKTVCDLLHHPFCSRSTGILSDFTFLDVRKMTIGLNRLVISFLIASLLTTAIVQAADGDVRLAGGTPSLGYKGRVEVEIQGTWGTACFNSWNLNDAHVICKQLGFVGGATDFYLVSSDNDLVSIATSVVPVWLNDVGCTGSETSISECPGVNFNPTSNPCSHIRDVAVTCALPGYLGCYSNRPSDWAARSSNQASLNIEQCLSVCRGTYDIAALYGGSGCLCGNAGQSQGVQESNTECNVPCVGDQGQRCGGAGQVTSYYDVNLGASGFATVSDKGSLTSPNFPGMYALGTSKRQSAWLVTFTQPSYTKVWFSLFDVRGTDSLSISGEFGGDIVVYRNGDSPEVWWSQLSNRLDALFSTNLLDAEARGFIMHYEATTSSPNPITTQTPTTTPILTTNELTTEDITPEITIAISTTGNPTTTPKPTTPVTTQPPIETTTVRITETRTLPGTLPPIPTFSGNEECSHTHGSSLTNRIDTDPIGDYLLINVGDPFTCNGFITQASHLSNNHVPFNISVWRQERPDEYYIVGRFTVPATPSGSISNVQLMTKDDWIPFRQGDYLGVSWYSQSPLMYSTGGTTDEASTWLRWKLQGQDADDYDDMNMGEWVSGMSDNAHPLVRAYSLQVATRDKIRCEVPYIEHGIIMPSDRDHVYEGDMLVVDCKPGYRPHFMVARCLETGTFDFEVDCKDRGNVTRPVNTFKGLNFTQVIIMVVAVGLFGLFVLVISGALLCGKSCDSRHRTGDSSKSSLPRVNLTASHMQRSPEKIDANLIPIDVDTISNFDSIEGGVYNQGGTGDYTKKPLSNNEGVNDYKHDIMGDGIYDTGAHMDIPPYLAQEASLQDNDIPPPPMTAPPTYDLDVSSSFTKRPTSLTGISSSNLPPHTSMSTITNPVASTPSSETMPDNVFSSTHI